MKPRSGIRCPRCVVAQRALKEHRALKALRAIGYDVTPCGPFVYFIVKRAG